MVMTLTEFAAVFILSSFGVSITEPAEGETYSGDWLTLSVLVTNDNQAPDSVVYTLNGGEVTTVPRLSTDWWTYMANGNRTGFSLSPAPLNNTILWAADSITGVNHEFSSPIVVNGTVFYISDEQSIAFALDAATGEVLWSYDVCDSVDDAPTWYEGKLYIGADSAFCLDAGTGARIWSFKPSTSDFKMNGNPAVEDGVAYFSYAPNWDSMDIYALDAGTGQEIWCTSLPNYSTGCVTLCGGSLFVPTHLGSLYALDKASGEIIWENSSSPLGYWDSSPVVVGDHIYICGEDGVARAIHRETGATEWETPISSWYIAATPAFAYGRMFFADQVDTFYCLDGATGNSVWEVPGTQHGSPGIADGIVFFGEGADRAMGEIRALSADTGAEIWSYPTGTGQNFSSPAITDGVVYISGMDWKLYAFGTELKFSYLDDLFAEQGVNQLLVSSWSGGSAVSADTVTFTVNGTGMEFGPSNMFNLAASPNPSTSSVGISYSLPEGATAEIDIFDLSGRLINCSPAGEGGMVWDGFDSSGRRVPSGVYICRIRYGDSIETIGLCRL